MKKTKKLLVSSMLSLSLAILLAVSVSAAPSSREGQISGYKVSGSITMGSSSATGYTSTHAPNGIVSVSVSYTYRWGLTTDFFTVTGGNGNANSGVSYTASAGHVNPQSLRASAIHSVSVLGQYWETDTSTP